MRLIYSKHLYSSLLVAFFGLVLNLLLSCKASSLTIAVVHDNVSERYNFIEIERNFNQKVPGIPIDFIGLSSAKYKPQIIEWLESATGPDVLFWHGGERLMQFVRQDYVENLDDLVKQYGWQKNFPAATLQAVSYQQSTFAIPLSIYQWGIFYNKPLLEKFNISPPRNWQDFVAACHVLKSNGIEPIAIGSNEPWVLGAWFDYINLRLNGLDFHQSLLKGDIAFTDQRVVKLFEYWAELVNGQYFLLGHEQLNWSSAMPYLLRKLSAFTLIGNFFSTRIPANLEQTIEFMPFPEIVPENSAYEDAPMDVFFIRASSKNKDDARKFITYLSQAEVQTNYNKYAGGFPPNKAGTTSDNKFNRAGLTLLQNAKGFSQFFDRDSVEDFSSSALEVLAEFMQNSDIDSTVKKLEQLRQSKLVNKTH
jgi:multiple sugar transport system substrate-binding protein